MSDAPAAPRVTGEHLCAVEPGRCPIDPEVAMQSWVQSWGYPLLATCIGIAVAVTLFLHQAQAASLDEHKAGDEKRWERLEQKLDTLLMRSVQP